MKPLDTKVQLDPDGCSIVLDAIFASSSTGYAVIDPTFHYVCVNRAFAEFSGIPVHNHIGRTVSEVLGLDAWIEREPLMRAALAGRPTEHLRLRSPVHIARTPASSVKTCYYPLTKHGASVGFLAAIIDYRQDVESESSLLQQGVEQRKIEEKRLLEQEERLQLALTNGKLGTWQLSLIKEELIEASAICKAAFGYEPDEPFGYREIVDAIHPDDLPAVLEAVRRCRDSGREYNAEYRTIWRDRTEHWVSATAQPTFDERGRPISLIGVSQDVSSRKQAEREKSELLAKIREFALLQAAFLRDVLASVTDGKLRLCQSTADLPLRGDPTGESISLTAHYGLKTLRQAAKTASLDKQFPDDRWQDLITAVSEAAMNAIVHAGGGEAEVLLAGDGCIQVWIIDEGKGIELENLPRATLEKGYTTTGTMGHGMKMMLQTADRVWLLTGPAGTTLVIEQDREPLKRDWL